MDTDRLRVAVGTAFSMAATHSQITEFVESIRILGSDNPAATKAERIELGVTAIHNLDRSRLREAANALLRVGHFQKDTQFLLQEALWWDDPRSPEISERVRRELAEAVDVNELFGSWADFIALVDGLWPLDDGPLGGIETALYGTAANNLRAKLFRHVAKNRGDWSTEEIFEQLGALTSSNRRFIRFVEGLSSWRVLRSVTIQEKFSEIVNGHLLKAGVQLQQAGEDGGYPRYQLVALGSTNPRRPKNLIFASTSKPDIRLASAVDNDLEVVNSDCALIYDRQIPTNGLTWTDLQAWWMDDQEVSDPVHGKGTLYRRLLAGVPDSSPPQKELFRAYYRVFRESVGVLPALLPEIWLHWDHKTVSQRGIQAMLNLRMDFLLLLPGGRRIVLEVDGMQHYAIDGYASPERYAKMMRGDRDLKLAGYEVYRFGTVELGTPEAADATVKKFFSALYRSHGIDHAKLD